MSIPKLRVDNHMSQIEQQLADNINNIVKSIDEDKVSNSGNKVLSDNNFTDEDAVKLESDSFRTIVKLTSAEYEALPFIDDNTIYKIQNIEFNKTINVSSLVKLKSTIDANQIHGSVIVGKYIYGSTRNKNYRDVTQTSCITKVSTIDPTVFINTPIYCTSEGVGNVVGIEQIVNIGDYLYAQCTNEEWDKTYLIKYKLEDDTYCIYLLDNKANRFAPIGSSTTLLFVTYDNKTASIDPKCYLTETKFNTSDVYRPTDGTYTYYDHDSQGGHILEDYNPRNKGYVHTVISDDTYLYLGFVSAMLEEGTITDANGYAVSINKTLHELHKIRISDMIGVDWMYVPKHTDDACQNDTHIFYSVELWNTQDYPLNSRTDGIDTSVYAINKSTFTYTALPNVNGVDLTRVLNSYGLVYINDYVYYIGTNNKLYVIDVSDADNWLVTNDIDNYIKQITTLQHANTDLPAVLNELLVDDNNTFYGFLWDSPSYFVKFTIDKNLVCMNGKHNIFSSTINCIESYPQTTYDLMVINGTTDSNTIYFTYDED